MFSHAITVRALSLNEPERASTSRSHTQRAQRSSARSRSIYAATHKRTNSHSTHACRHWRVCVFVRCLRCAAAAAVCSYWKAPVVKRNSSRAVVIGERCALSSTLCTVQHFYVKTQLASNGTLSIRCSNEKCVFALEFYAIKAN